MIGPTLGVAPDPLAALTAAGVSVWLDDLSRARLTNGTLATLVADAHVRGITTNPTIFARAITGSDAYDSQLQDLARRKVEAGEALRAITTADVRAGCDLLRGIHDSGTPGDGRVSIEVDPRICHDTEATIAEARALWWLVDRPNVYVKIPATPEGLPAITRCLAEGISINVTLIFGLDRYRAVLDAFLDGLERHQAAGRDLTRVASVASLFVSRVDTEIDRRLDRLAAHSSSPQQADVARQLRGRAAIANARLAYALFEETLSTPRWQALADAGATPQRPLWASTGVKDPAYPDTRYVTDLVAPSTVNTMPEGTLRAVADHAHITGDTIHGTYADAQATLDALAELGIDYDDVVTQLERDGLATFNDSWNQLSTTLDKQLHQRQARAASTTPPAATAPNSHGTRCAMA
jgi:transaldolase